MARAPGPGAWGRTPVPNSKVAARCLTRWWEVQRERVDALEGPSFGLDPTISKLCGREILRNKDLRDFAGRLCVDPGDLLAYRALADGPFGRYRVAAVFPRPPDEKDPVVLCLDEPRGRRASWHRNGGAALCLYYEDDPPERRWQEEDQLVRLFDLARQHLACEHVFRETGAWPIDEAPHGETSPAPSNPTLRLPPLRWPSRSRPCPCGSGRKAKRCCFT